MATTTVEEKKTTDKPTDKPAAVKSNTEPQVDIDPIQVEVNNNWNLRESIIALINGVSARIQAAKDANEVQSVASRLKERAASWADAVLNNTQYAPVAGTPTEKAEKKEPDKK